MLSPSYVCFYNAFVRMEAAFKNCIEELRIGIYNNDINKIWQPVNYYIIQKGVQNI